MVRAKNSLLTSLRLGCYGAEVGGAFSQTKMTMLPNIQRRGRELALISPLTPGAVPPLTFPFGDSTTNLCTMKPKLCRCWGLTAILLISGCCSSRHDPVRQSQPPQSRIQQSAPLKTTHADADRAKQMVRRGRQYYEEGRLHSAQRAFQTATEIDPRNNEAWYFLDRVRRKIDGREGKELHHRDIQKEATTAPNPRSSQLRGSASLLFTPQWREAAALSVS